MNAIRRTAFGATLSLSLMACTTTNDDPKPTPASVGSENDTSKATDSREVAVEAGKRVALEAAGQDEQEAQTETADDGKKLAERFGQNGKKMNMDIAGVGTEAFEAVFPSKSGGFERTNLQSSAAGTAGMWADGAMATYGKGDRELQMHVTDMIRVSECKVGKWAAYLDEVRNKPDEDLPVEVVEVGKHHGIYAESTLEGVGVIKSLRMRFGDRCTLDVSSQDGSRAEMIRVAKGLDLDGLETTCAKRDPGGAIGLGL